MTSDLEVRRIDWQFEPEDTPFLWNPDQPGFSQVANAISFLAPPLERYFVAVTQMALERIEEPDAQDEAERFLRQEALHARAHRGHVKALVTQHPALADLTPALERSFDALLEREALEFHLAYMAGLEATFTPVFRAILEHQDVLSPVVTTGSPRCSSGTSSRRSSTERPRSRSTDRSGPTTTS